MSQKWLHACEHNYQCACIMLLVRHGLDPELLYVELGSLLHLVLIGVACLFNAIQLASAFVLFQQLHRVLVIVKSHHEEDIFVIT